jgi:hypothetical protein
MIDDIQDFTCSTPFEKLISDIESQLREWGPNCYQNMEASLTFPRYDIKLSLINATSFRADHFNCVDHPLISYYGFHSFLLLEASLEHVTKDEATYLLSALTVASNAVSYGVPVFASFGHYPRNTYLGRTVLAKDK